jgi:hypothetical protein
MPVFVYKQQEIHLSNQQCLGLELILNLTDEYKQYIKLGDKLYDSFLGREEYHTVNTDEFNWLKNNIQYLHP